MNSLRASLTSIPGAVSNIISESASTVSSLVHLSLPSAANTASTPLEDCSVDSSYSGPNHDKSWPIPASLVKEQWRLIFTSDANARDLEAAIAHCRDLVMLSDECSEERIWLIRHLVDLRFALKEVQEHEVDQASGRGQQNTTAIVPMTVVGHHFIEYRWNRGGLLQSGVVPTTQLCDHCTGIIWSVVQAAYICKDCNYVAHQKCVDSVLRVCAHVTVSERRIPIPDICPEIGLAAQRYKCAECGTLLNFKHHWVEPRLCDYNGLYYCPSCHWNDFAVIPARVVHNWDFTQRKVCRASLQELNLFHDRPVIKLEEANAKLFFFLEKLGTLKKQRQNLWFMRKYLLICRLAIEQKLLDTQMGRNRHLVQSQEFYSLNDLEQAESGALSDFLGRVLFNFEQHIRGCPLCSAHAYICEICSNNEVIYPFDDCCIICEKCKSIHHRVCMIRKNKNCPKCARIRMKHTERRLRRMRWKEAMKKAKEANDDVDGGSNAGGITKVKNELPIDSDDETFSDYDDDDSDDSDK